MPKIAASLLDGGSNVSIYVQNGGLMKIDVDDLPKRKGVLMWCLTPKQLRMMADPQP